VLAGRDFRHWPVRTAGRRVFVTGMSGPGKSTILDELRRRGLLAVDTDYDGWEMLDGIWDDSHWMDSGQAPGHHRSGTVENQVSFDESFEHIVLLSAAFNVLMQRSAWPRLAHVRRPVAGSWEGCSQRMSRRDRRGRRLCGLVQGRATLTQPALLVVDLNQNTEGSSVSACGGGHWGQLTLLPSR
jgi:hypothetical protein